MLFHLTMTHTEDNCPGYNREMMPNLLEAGERLPTVAKDLGVTVHSLVWVLQCGGTPIPAVQNSLH